MGSNTIHTDWKFYFSPQPAREMQACFRDRISTRDYREQESSRDSVPCRCRLGPCREPGNMNCFTASQHTMSTFSNHKRVACSTFCSDPRPLPQRMLPPHPPAAPTRCQLPAESKWPPSHPRHRPTPVLRLPSKLPRRHWSSDYFVRVIRAKNPGDTVRRLAAFSTFTRESLLPVLATEHSNDRHKSCPDG